MMGWNDHDMAWGGWVAMSAIMVVFWVLVVAAVVVLFRDSESGRSPQPRPDPRQVLDDRLARGQITTEEYRELRSALEESTATPPAATAPGGASPASGRSRPAGPR